MQQCKKLSTKSTKDTKLVFRARIKIKEPVIGFFRDFRVFRGQNAFAFGMSMGSSHARYDLFVASNPHGYALPI